MLPREKFNNFGISNLSLKDLIAIVVASGNTKRNVFQISDEVYKIFKRGNFTYENLVKVRGLGSVKAMKLICGVEIGFRLVSTDPVIAIKTSQKAYETVRYIARYKQEHFVCVYLNARYELLGKKTVGIGTVDSVQVLPRDIIIYGLNLNAIYVILAHNHPSGSLLQSKEDIEVTKRVKKALEIVGMSLLDHIIITNNLWSRVEII